MADLVIIAGAQTELTFPVQNIAEGVTITSAAFTLKRFVEDSTIVLQHVLGDGQMTCVDNVLTVQFLWADLQWIGPQDRGFFYDVQVHLSDGSGPFTVEIGRLRCRLPITQSA